MRASMGSLIDLAHHLFKGKSRKVMAFIDDVSVLSHEILHGIFWAMTLNDSGIHDASPFDLATANRTNRLWRKIKKKRLPAFCHCIIHSISNQPTLPI
jgi:hypothetical protein